MISSKFYDALEVVLYIAINYFGEPISSKTICKSQGRNARNLETLLQSLVQNKILIGSKGPKGGYVLAKEKRKINLYQIYQAVSLENNFANQSQKNYIKGKVIAPLAKKIDDSNKQILLETTIADMCPKNVEKNAETQEFCI